MLGIESAAFRVLDFSTASSKTEKKKEVASYRNVYREVSHSCAFFFFFCQLFVIIIIITRTLY